MDPKKETEKKLPMKSVENKNKFSQAKLLAGAVKHRRLVSHFYKFLRNGTQLAVERETGQNCLQRVRCKP